MFGNILLMVLGAALFVFASKLEFDRTNANGVQEFDSFLDSFTADIEGVVFRILGFCMFMPGLIMLMLGKTF